MGLELKGKAGNFQDIVMWKRPLISASVALSINLVYLLLYVANRTFFEVACVVALGFLFFGACLRLAELPQQTENAALQIVKPETIETTTLWIFENLNNILTRGRGIVLWHDPVKSATVAAAISLFGALAAPLLPFSLTSFILLFFIFTGHAITSVYEASIQKHVESMFSKTRNFFNLWYSKIPRIPQDYAD